MFDTSGDYEELVTGHLSLTAFTGDHLVLLSSWLRQTHVAQWYPEPSAHLEWASAPPECGSQVLLEVECRPIGYLRWQSVDRSTLDSVGLTGVPTYSVDADILIGERSCVAMGYGPQALLKLASLLKRRGDVPLIGLTTSKENELAHKAFRKAGFTIFAEYSPEGFGDCFLFGMLLG